MEDLGCFPAFTKDNAPTPTRYTPQQLSGIAYEEKVHPSNLIKGEREGNEIGTDKLGKEFRTRTYKYRQDLFDVTVHQWEDGSARVNMVRMLGAFKVDVHYHYVAPSDRYLGMGDFLDYKGTFVSLDDSMGVMKICEHGFGQGDVEYGGWVSHRDKLLTAWPKFVELFNEQWHK